MATNRFYAPRIRIPDVLERGHPFDTSLPVYRDNALVPPLSGTFRLVDKEGTEIIAETAVTVSANIATYAIGAGSLPATLAFSDSWTQYWNLTFDGVEFYDFKKPCALARSALYPVISDLDLEAEYSSISKVRPPGDPTFQAKIDEAWVEIINKIRAMGNLEYLIMSPETLRSSHKHFTLWLIYKDAANTGMGQDSTYRETSREHLSLYKEEFASLVFKYDLDEDGNPDEEKRAAAPVIFTNKPVKWRWGY
mgnify:CR=1 FL=1